MKNNIKKQQQLVDDFNSNYDDSIQEVTIRASANLMGGHSAMGWFEEISGCYSLERVIS